VLDVDGHVIDAADLIERVDQLVKTIDDKNPRPGPASDRGDEIVEPRLGAPLLPMSALHRDLYPRDIGPAPGVKGQASKFSKRLVRKLTGWYVEPRWTTQQDYDGHNIHFATGVVDAMRRMDDELERLRLQNVQLRLQIVTSVERLHRHRRDVATLLENLATKTDIRDLNRQIGRLGVEGSSGAKIDYAEFEDRCRGSSADLREAQAHYVSKFPPPEGGGKILDIGCGRGEMLEVLIEGGYDVLGVDVNEEMVEVCRSKGLPVVLDDGIHVLEETEDASLRGIFCAQVVEHLLTSEMERLIELCARKLLPNGVLVVETINPRSSFALGNHYFADTSHVKPVHPETLRFICEQVGFSRVELEETSPHPIMDVVDDLPDDQIGSAMSELIRNVFGNQDYAIVATR
jgi:2-polyprenyl-3-methyl-5-hydroxy-6-metoxy-1,4-benzoquinol methylase